jgi:hypothetical protein
MSHNSSSVAGQLRTPSQAIAAALRAGSSGSSSSTNGSSSKESVPVLAVSKSTRARHNRGGSSSSSSTAVTTSSSSSIIIKSPAAVETKQAWKVSIAPPVLDNNTADDTDCESVAVPAGEVLKQENAEPLKGAAKRRKKVKADVQVDAAEGITPSAETAAAVKPRRNRSRAVKA